ncbi:MAG: PocR ligand-binding domain-containing protein [Thermodesulfobacteriota bacterium]
MQMTDLLSKEQWKDFEQTLHEKWRVNACAYEASGLSFTGFKNFINPLCAKIKSFPEGIQAICSVAHQHMARQAKAARKTIIEQCDAGLLKICTPVFAGDEFVGIVGGCGRLPAGEEVDTFTIEKATGLPHDEVMSLAAQVPAITMREAEDMARFLEDFVGKAVAAVRTTSA